MIIQDIRVIGSHEFEVRAAEYGEPAEYDCPRFLDSATLRSK